MPALTMGIVAHCGHPLLAGEATVEALAGWPWVDCGADLRPGPETPSLDDLLSRRVMPEYKLDSVQHGCGKL